MSHSLHIQAPSSWWKVPRPHKSQAGWWSFYGLFVTVCLSARSWKKCKISTLIRSTQYKKNVHLMGQNADNLFPETALWMLWPLLAWCNHSGHHSNLNTRWQCSLVDSVVWITCYNVAEVLTGTFQLRSLQIWYSWSTDQISRVNPNKQQPMCDLKGKVLLKNKNKQRSVRWAF